MTPEQLKDIALKINTQDGRATRDPFFCVFEKEEIIGMDSDYCSDYVWIDDDHNEISIDDLIEMYGLTEEQAENGDHGYNLQKVYYMERDRFVNAHFTEAAAEEHIRINGHNLRKPFVYVTSLFRCNEMVAIREFLKSGGIIEG